MSQQCTHPPVMNLQMKIVSPACHYGDGYDGQIICEMCHQIIGHAEKGRMVYDQPTVKGGK